MSFDVTLRNPGGGFNVVLETATGAKNIWVLASGAWKQVTNVYCLKDGVWKEVTEFDVLVGGSWKTV